MKGGAGGVLMRHAHAAKNTARKSNRDEGVREKKLLASRIAGENELLSTLRWRENV